jgi:hypothetical protein
MRRNHLELLHPGFERDLARFGREVGLFGRNAAREAGLLGRNAAREFGHMALRGRYGMRNALGTPYDFRRQSWAAGPWVRSPWVPSPWPLGLGLCGLRGITRHQRRQALRYRSHYRRRRFWRQVQVLLGVGLVALVIFLMARNSDSNNNSNWL